MGGARLSGLRGSYRVGAARVEYNAAAAVPPRALNVRRASRVGKWDAAVCPGESGSRAGGPGPRQRSPFDAPCRRSGRVPNKDTPAPLSDRVRCRPDYAERVTLIGSTGRTLYGSPRRGAGRRQEMVDVMTTRDPLTAPVCGTRLL